MVFILNPGERVLFHQYTIKGDVDDVENYRGMTLNNYMAKIYSHVINNRLLELSCHNDKIIHSQFGLKPKKRLLILYLYSMLFLRKY